MPERIGAVLSDVDGTLIIPGQPLPSLEEHGFASAMEHYGPTTT